MVFHRDDLTIVPRSNVESVCFVPAQIESN